MTNAKAPSPEGAFFLRMFSAKSITAILYAPQESEGKPFGHKKASP